MLEQSGVQYLQMIVMHKKKHYNLPKLRKDMLSRFKSCVFLVRLLGNTSRTLIGVWTHLGPCLTRLYQLPYVALRVPTRFRTVS